MITKICNICNKELPIEEFYNNGNKKIHNNCKKCFTKDIQIRQIEKKKKAVYYLGGKCKHCGIDNIIVLEFHHLDKIKKEVRWSIMKGWSWDRILKEIKKCIPLCANCHKIEHATFYAEISLNSNNY